MGGTWALDAHEWFLCTFVGIICAPVPRYLNSMSDFTRVFSINRSY
jgi:hypothetical protein